jgi:hypothetical protein
MIGADRHHILQAVAVQGDNEGATLAVEAVGQDDAQAQTPGKPFLDDLERQLRVGPVDIARFEAGRGLEDAEEQRDGGGPSMPSALTETIPLASVCRWPKY